MTAAVGARPRLAALLSPRTIALVGASPDVHIFRGRTLKVMLEHPYTGRIYPVSRSHAEIQGLRAYPTVAAIPEPVDLAILIIPAEHVPDELERCGVAGVRAAMVLASGFAEARGAAGPVLQARLVEIAARHGMILCGPNAEGYANTAEALCPTFSPVVENMTVPLVPPWRSRGHVAVVAQSGGIGFGLFDRGRPKELPFSYVITTGNEACLETFEVIEHLLDDGKTDVFLLFLESIKDPRSFERAAARALAAGKPIIVAKIGKSYAGARASLAHTAAVTGNHAAYQAVFRRHGIIEAADIDEMVDLAAAFSLLGDRLPAGVRVGIGTASGGGGGWLADACVAAGLTLPILDPATRAQLDERIPLYGSSQNPVDATAQAIVQAGYGELARVIAASDEVDAVIVIVSARSALSFEKERDKLAAIAQASPKPIVMWSYTLPSADTTRILSQAGYPLITSMQSCARTVAALARYRQIRERRLRELREPVVVGAGGAAGASGIAGASGAGVAERAPLGPIGAPGGSASAVLQGHGIAVADTAPRHSLDAHGPAGPGVGIELAVRRDPTFGPMLRVAVAGQIVLTPVPLSAAEAADHLAALGATALQAVDIPALIDLLVRLARLASDRGDLELELGGVVVHGPGRGVVIGGAHFVDRAAT